MIRRLPLIVAALALGAIATFIAISPTTSMATGVVVAVDARSLTDVPSFTLRVAGGQTLEFQLSRLENGTEFPPGHLTEHIASGGPVVVTYREEDGVLYAIRLVDGPIVTVPPAAT